MRPEPSLRAARIGMLAGLTIALQLSPAILPGIGLALSAFSTLPIYVLTRMSPAEGLIGLAASAALLAAFHPGGALLLVLMTGPVGLVLGWAGHAHLRVHWRILLSAAAQTVGMEILGTIVGAPMFSRLMQPQSQWVLVALIGGYSLVYSFLWAAVLENAVLPLLRRTPFGRDLGR